MSDRKPEWVGITTYFDKRGRVIDIDWAFSGEGSGYVEVTVEAMEEILREYRSSLRRGRKWWWRR